MESAPTPAREAEPAAPLGFAAIGEVFVGPAAVGALGGPLPGPAEFSRWHPVAGFGQAAGALERHLYRPDRTAGTAFT
ncbi:hypothetical protein ABZ749_32350, partial [Micromonospora sp. NPDC047753]